MTPDTILDRACAVFAIARAELVSSSRKRHIVYARQAAALALHRRTTLSLVSIGELLHIHHTSALYAIRAAETRAEADAGYAAQLGELLDAPAPTQAPAPQGLSPRVQAIPRGMVLWGLLAYDLFEPLVSAA